MTGTMAILGGPYTSREPVGDGTEPWHGRASGYNYHRCGCTRCRGWMARTKQAQKVPLAARPQERERLALEDTNAEMRMVAT